ncbi:MAG TPA: hypothetical protein DDW36_04305 [Candidatus Magasanikbacteria bacterium]|nr:hypothetical protein [Candidatus Magasanikbacteria bacterium]
MLLTFALFLFSLFLVIKSADFSVRYSTRLAKNLHLPKYIIGFLIVAIISIFPESFISITSAIQGVPSFGLGTLFGSNVADLTLVFALIVFVSGRRNLTVESKVIKNKLLHIGIILIPVVFGLNGYYSRIEGVSLIIAGLLFFSYVLSKNEYGAKKIKEKFVFADVLLFAMSMIALLLGSYLTVRYSLVFANDLQVSPLLIGIFIVGLGTTVPELFFSIRAAKKHHDDLAFGDILGTVMADATIVLGIMAAISPFSFNPRLVYVTGVFMVLAMLLLFYFMKSGKVLTKKEAFFLLLFYTAFVISEMFLVGLY